MSQELTPFIGLPDDVARLGVQRLMACDVRARAHSRLASRWNSVDLFLSAATAVAASLAAVSYLKAGWLGIALSIVVATLVPLQRSLGSGGKAAEHAKAATLFGSLADSYERYLQLDIGPMAWRHETENIENVRRHLDKMDGEVTGANSQAPRARFRAEEKAATESRGDYLVEYLSMPNVLLPPREAWVP